MLRPPKSPAVARRQAPSGNKTVLLDFDFIGNDALRIKANSVLISSRPTAYALRGVPAPYSFVAWVWRLVIRPRLPQSERGAPSLFENL